MTIQLGDTVLYQSFVATVDALRHRPNQACITYTALTGRETHKWVNVNVLRPCNDDAEVFFEEDYPIEPGKLDGVNL